MKKSKMLVAELADEIQSDIAPAMWDNVEQDRQCSVCGKHDWEFERVKATAITERYEADCYNCNGDGACEFEWATVKWEGIPPLGPSKPKNTECSECGASNGVEDLRERHEPKETVEYNLPIRYVVQYSIHAHHTSYYPENTIDVCSSCHTKIHMTKGDYSDLKPDNRRPA